MVGDVVAQAAGAAISRFDFVLEGGALEHNGAGSILTTRQCLLNTNRNADWSQAQAEAMLTDAFHCRRVLWLETGLLNDHTDGHVDNLARFIAPDTVVCQSASGDDDPNASLYETLAEELGAMDLIVQRIPSPGKICSADGEVMPASHMNFIIGNEAVVVPIYNQQYGDAAVHALQKLFPGRKVVRCCLQPPADRWRIISLHYATRARLAERKATAPNTHSPDVLKEKNHDTKERQDHRSRHPVILC